MRIPGFFIVTILIQAKATGWELSVLNEATKDFCWNWKRQGGTFMDFIEKARIRLENWISHNGHHQEEYEIFAEELAEAGKNESSKHVREMIELTAESNEYLRRALEALH